MAATEGITYDILDVARFWSGVDVAAPSSCWTWKRAKSALGYGMFRVCGLVLGTHRFAWLLASGSLPEVVRHKCDNPSCCNPLHLESGTHAENVKDRVTRNRGAKGADNGRAKLTEEKVASILRDNRRSAEVAAEHGIDPSTVRHIKAGRIWKHITG